MSLRIVLLGAGGQLGTEIRREFAQMGNRRHEVIPVVRKQLDMEAVGEIRPFLSALGKVDYVINCTAFHQTDLCEDLPVKAFTVNAAAVAELARYCRDRDAVLIHFSTDYVFDGKIRRPYREHDSTRPLNTYGVSKLSGELLIRAYHGRHFIFRVSSLFGLAGASGKGGNFVETMLKLAQTRHEIAVVDDQIMSPTHARDVAHVICRFVDRRVDEFGIYHCSGEGECSWYQFAAEIFRLCGVKRILKPVSSHWYAKMSPETKAVRPAYSVLDNGKLRLYCRMPAWQESLRNYLSLKGYGP